MIDPKFCPREPLYSPPTPGGGGPAPMGAPSTGESSTGESSTGEPSAEEPSTGDPSTGEPSTGDPSVQTAPSADPPYRPGAPLPPGVWEELRAPFRESAYGTYMGDVSDQLTKTIVEFRLHPKVLIDRLDAVLGPGGYALDFELLPARDEKVARCRLRIGGASRAGVGTSSEWPFAAGTAQVRAAQRFGIGTEGPDAGPIVADLEHRIDVPEEVRARLESRRETSRWAAGEG